MQASNSADDQQGNSATAPMGLLADAIQGDKSPSPPAALRTTENVYHKTHGWMTPAEARRRVDDKSPGFALAFWLKRISS